MIEKDYIAKRRAATKRLNAGIRAMAELTLKRYSQTGTSKAYAYRVNEIEVLPGTLGGRIALATDPTGTTSICGSILLNGVPEVNGLAKEVS